MARILECRERQGFYDPRKEGHLGRECQDNPVDIELLASDAVYDEAPAAPRDADAVSGERRTYAQIAKDASYTQSREAHAIAEEKRCQPGVPAVKRETTGLRSRLLSSATSSPSLIC